MKYFVLLAAFSAATIHAADQTQTTVIIRQVLKDAPLHNSNIFFDDHPFVTQEKVITIPSHHRSIEHIENAIKFQENIEGDIIGEQTHGTTRTIVFHMRSHRKNPDTRNAE